MRRKVNLWDNNFPHTPKCSVKDRTPEHIEWVRGQLEGDITIMTDWYIFEPVPVRSTYKIGWLLEPRSVSPDVYTHFPTMIDKFNFTLTHDADLLKIFPSKTRFAPVGGTWIHDDNIKIHPKTDHVSMIYSSKTHLPGHKLRHDIADAFPEIDRYGNSNPILNKEDGLVDYRFSVAVENSRATNYFTEKLLDCFATGTVPVYWGCPNIGDFFDTDGILQFNTLEELSWLLPTLKGRYESMEGAIQKNFELMQEYKVTEDWIMKNILEGLDIVSR